MLRRKNEALPGLVLGIILFGVLVQLSGVWFVKDQIRYTTGLWFGVAVAIWMAINLADVIYDSVSMGDEKNANRRIIAKSVFRYVVVVVLFFILGYFNLGNLITAFIGVLGLKISAYAQPMLEKALTKISGRDDATSDGQNSETKQTE